MGVYTRIVSLIVVGTLWSAGGIAQQGADIQSVEPATPPADVQPGSDQDIFRSLQIELLDLDNLREEIGSKLVGEPIEMTLDQCVRMAMLYNQDILVQGFDVGMADADLMAARGQFDPNLALTADYSYSETPASSQVIAFSGISDSITSRQQNYQLGINGQTWVGTRYDFGYLVNRERGTFTTPRDPVTGEPLETESIYTANWTLSITQPLLRGMGTKANMVFVKRAKNNQAISDAQAELVLLTTVGEVVKAYWDLVGAVEQLTVQQESLDNATRVMNINQQRYDLGTASALEVLSAKAGVAQRQSDLVSARARVFDAEDILKTRMGMYDATGELISGANIIPMERPVIHDPEIDLETSMRLAIERRPDVRTAEFVIANAEVDLKASRNDLFPQLDFSTSYGRNTVQLDGNEIFDGLNNPDGRSWTFGAVASIPIGNRAARGNYQRNKLYMRQQEQRLLQVRQNAMLNVRLAIHALAANRILVESTKQARILEEANVTAEEKRLRIGVTTAQNVLDIQEDLTAAQAREVQAQVDFERSLIDLQVAEGTLLENLNIVYEAPTFDKPLGAFESYGPIDTEN